MASGCCFSNGGFLDLKQGVRKQNTCPFWTIWVSQNQETSQSFESSRGFLAGAKWISSVYRYGCGTKPQLHNSEPSPYVLMVFHISVCPAIWHRFGGDPRFAQATRHCSESSSVHSSSQQNAVIPNLKIYTSNSPIKQLNVWTPNWQNRHPPQMQSGSKNYLFECLESWGRFLRVPFIVV